MSVHFTTRYALPRVPRQSLRTRKTPNEENAPADITIHLPNSMDQCPAKIRPSAAVDAHTLAPATPDAC